MCHSNGQYQVTSYVFQVAVLGSFGEVYLWALTRNQIKIGERLVHLPMLNQLSHTLLLHGK